VSRRVTWMSVALALAVGACGGAEKPRATATATATAAAKATPTVTIAVSDQAACASLYARLQRVTLAITSGSELIARSTDPAELTRRIATQRRQLERAAALMDNAVVPAPLAATNRSLVTALRRFAGDFRRAQAPARSGDFAGAAQAMSDTPTVGMIAAAAKKIQDACKPR
jgi:3-hydroxyisobutyrate dehydrogenase-like beta-hydroxyacid dehydrogenase